MLYTTLIPFTAGPLIMGKTNNPCPLLDLINQRTFTVTHSSEIEINFHLIC
jgi:hypothetical protein